MRREIEHQCSKIEKPKEKLSERELKELMGVYRDKYKKVRGRVRSR